LLTRRYEFFAAAVAERESARLRAGQYRFATAKRQRATQLAIRGNRSRAVLKNRFENLKRAASADCLEQATQGARETGRKLERFTPTDGGAMARCQVGGSNGPQYMSSMLR
jgi:hypothetical protein